MTDLTVFGAGGFVGRAVVTEARARGLNVRAVTRGDDSWRGAPLGTVICTIGRTADFRTRPHETIEAHGAVLSDLLQHGRFEHFLWCSSTRVYAGVDATAEDTVLRVNPNDPDQLYNISKLAGEALCLALPHPGIRVARLSNVVGPGMPAQTFLASLMAAANRGHIDLGQALGSSKDYIVLGDVVRALLALALAPQAPRLVNIASGRNTSHQAIVQLLQQQTGCTIRVRPDAPTVTFPAIDTTRLRRIDAAPMADVLAFLAQDHGPAVAA